MRGEFDVAASGFAAAAAGMAATEPHRVDAIRPSDTIVAAHLHMACMQAMRGDLVRVEAELAAAKRRIDDLGFPRAPFVRAHALSIESMVCTETGRLSEAHALATNIVDLSERHGLETARLTGTTQLVAVRALMTLNDTEPDTAQMTEHITALTALLDEWRVRGVNIYRTYFDGVLALLLTATGDPESARRRLDSALRLADDTGMHYYDAELLRFRAQPQRHRFTRLGSRRLSRACPPSGCSRARITFCARRIPSPRRAGTGRSHRCPKSTADRDYDTRAAARGRAHVSSSTDVSTSSGSPPRSSARPWNSRNDSPRPSISSRSCCQIRCPIAYDGACPGQPR